MDLVRQSPKKNLNNFLLLQMLSVVSGNTGGAVAMERLRGGTPGRGGSGGRTRHHQHQLQVMVAAQRDRAVRLHSVHTDLELDLPPSIALPDGEEHPYGTSARLKLRDSEQVNQLKNHNPKNHSPHKTPEIFLIQVETLTVCGFDCLEPLTDVFDVIFYQRDFVP